jgi:hypothetical protein
MSTKREQLLKQALGLLLAAELEPNLEPHPEIGLWDDEIIAQYRTMISARIATLDETYGKQFRTIASELESDPQAIGSNGTIAHALAVEVGCTTINIPR